MEKALRSLLDGEHADDRNRVREWLEEPGHEPVFDLPRDEYRERVLAWATDLAGHGAAALGYPEGYGGEGRIGAMVSGFEALAFGDLSLLVKVGVQFGLFGGAIQHLGTERHHERYLEAVSTLELPGCFAMTEAGHGSNVQMLRTTATYDHEAGEFVVHTPDESAVKDYIGNALHGRMAVVFAQLHVGGEEHGVHALLVPLRTEDGTLCPGVRVEDCGPKLGLDGVDNGRITFDEVRVGREALLNRYADVTEDGEYTSDIESVSRRFFTQIGTLVMGRISICGASISAAKVAQVLAVRHALERRQFGPPDADQEALLLDYRVHQRRLLPALAQTYALHFTQEGLVARLHDVFTDSGDRDEDRRELETLAAGLKAIASWHATRTIQECREACGGLGYLRANRFASLRADTDVFTTFEGDNTVLLQLVAKTLLTEQRDHLGELNPFGTMQFMAGQAVEMAAEKTAVREILGRIADDLLPGRGDDDGDLLDRGTQLDLFRWRQEHILSGAARRLKSGIDDDRDPFDVLIEAQDHVLDCARAWVDLVVLEAFAEKVESVEDPDLRELLDRLCSLHALSRIEAERGWYQEHGRLSSTRSKAVIKAVNTLCGEVRDDASLLVEAFGVPEACLDRPGKRSSGGELRPAA